jgi:hypothetical protein
VPPSDDQAGFEVEAGMMDDAADNSIEFCEAAE